MSLLSEVLSEARNRIPYSSETIIKKISDYDTVSFDVFDTIVKRSVDNPSDIFEITAIRFNQMNSFEIDSQKFKSDRENAEIAAKLQAYNDGREEITLEEIYSHLDASYAAIKGDLQKIEIAQEKNTCYPNGVIKRVYDWCLSHKKRVIAISDMYLSLETVKEILMKCGFYSFNKIYLSSEIGNTKRSGNLVQIVYETECKRDGKTIIHIGDSFSSDYIAFKKNGIQSILISKTPNFTVYSRKQSLIKSDRKTYRKLINIIASQSDYNDSIPYKYGFECEGPLLYGFSCWLYKQLVEGGYEKVFFLARDGFLMQKMYQHPVFLAVSE